jgi:hypothetical protein
MFIPSSNIPQRTFPLRRRSPERPLVDLVGTGRTETIDLPSGNENDCISFFFWRTVDLNMGAIEFFDDANFGGNRATVFLSEWDYEQIYSISDWWLQDRLSSIRWKTLTDRQTAVLFDNNDGSGNTYGNIKGWGDLKEIPNLDNIGFNDAVSAFRWDGKPDTRPATEL